MKDERAKQIFRAVKNILLIILIIIVIIVPAFIYFKLSTEARMALREAKNVKLTIEMLDVTYYAKGTTVYAPEMKYGLRNGVAGDVKKILELDENAAFELLSYDKSDRVIREMTYSNNAYIVRYEKKDSGNRWRVSYLLPIISLGTDN